MSSAPPIPGAIPHTIPLPGGIPSTHRAHTESTTTILVHNDNIAFLNPVQQYNRDLSVAVIRAWNETRKEEAEARWKRKYEREEGRSGGLERRKNRAGKRREKKAAEGVTVEGLGPGEIAPEKPEASDDTPVNATQPVAGPSNPPRFHPQPITILEALSATGLRAIRYAKEIPDVKYVLANDISPSACEAMRQNISFNGVGEDYGSLPSQANDKKGHQASEGLKEEEKPSGAVGEAEEGSSAEHEAEMTRLGRRPGCEGRVKVTEGDACTLMYSRRAGTSRVDVVDLDPYGTAAPFVDAAIGCIADGGLLAVTCTDLAVLAGSQYPEKCFSNYGGVSVNAEYSHEAALRLVLSSLAQTAARYGRYITPLLSFSIDFYVRLFVRVDTQPSKVKEVQSQTGVVYVCGYCQAPTIQPFGRIIEKETRSGNVQQQYKTAPGPPGVGSGCEHCGGTQHLGGPMWLGPIQDTAFAERVIKSTAGQEADYKTWPRIQGMMHMAKDELPDAFYFTPNKLHGMFHATSGPASQFISALYNGGYNVSRSHASSGSIKTNAPRSFIYDIIRENVKKNPVRLDKIAEGSPARKLLAGEMRHTIDLTPHFGAKKFHKDSLVRYQANPEANWGPLSRAKNVQSNGKRKAEDEVPGPTERRAVAGTAAGTGGDAKRIKEEAKPETTAETAAATVEVTDKPVTEEEEAMFNV